MVSEVGIFDVLKMILILAVILVCTYYATKFLAAKASGMSMGTGSKKIFGIGDNIGEGTHLPRVIHRMMVNRDSSLVLIEYNKHDYLVAFTPSGVQVIEKRELTEEETELRDNDRQTKEQNSFSKYMDKYVDKFRESRENKGVDKIEKED